MRSWYVKSFSRDRCVTSNLPRCFAIARRYGGDIGVRHFGDVAVVSTSVLSAESTGVLCRLCGGHAGGHGRTTFVERSVLHRHVSVLVFMLKLISVNFFARTIVAGSIIGETGCENDARHEGDPMTSGARNGGVDWAYAAKACCRDRSAAGYAVST